MSVEEHLQKLQEALHSHASVSEALSHAVQETEDRLEQHHDFVKAVQQFQDDLAARNEAALANADNLVVRLVGKFDSASEALLGVLTQSFKTANDDAQALQNVCTGFLVPTSIANENRASQLPIIRLSRLAPLFRHFMMKPSAVMENVQSRKTSP